MYTWIQFGLHLWTTHQVIFSAIILQNLSLVDWKIDFKNMKETLPWTTILLLFAVGCKFLPRENFNRLLVDSQLGFALFKSDLLSQNYLFQPWFILGSRVGAVVGVLAFHQCVPGSIPGPGVICGLSLLLVLYSAPRGFSPGTPVFSSPQKPTFLNSNSIWTSGTLVMRLWLGWSRKHSLC